MKRVILIAGMLIGICGFAGAQTSGSNSTNGPTHSSEGNRLNNKKGKKQKKTALNHRRNYNWKTGQQATPTGQEATGVGGGYSSIKKDTAGKRED
jgi:hypothetical protein